MGDILKTINAYSCIEHGSTLTLDHLQQHNIDAYDMDYYFLRGDDNRESEKRQKYKYMWENLEKLKGEKKYQK